ncbi:hypothetical protein HK405_000436, partial [Cladochytrium tenue]
APHRPPCDAGSDPSRSPTSATFTAAAQFDAAVDGVALARCLSEEAVGGDDNADRDQAPASWGASGDTAVAAAIALSRLTALETWPPSFPTGKHGNLFQEEYVVAGFSAMENARIPSRDDGGAEEGGSEGNPDSELGDLDGISSFPANPLDDVVSVSRPTCSACLEASCMDPDHQYTARLESITPQRRAGGGSSRTSFPFPVAVIRASPAAVLTALPIFAADSVAFRNRVERP